MQLRTDKQWQWLSKKGRAAKRCWGFLTSTVISNDAAVTLGEFCLTVLRAPEPPTPRLRREAEAYDSILQDYLAYSTIDDFSTKFGDPEIAAILDDLDTRADDLYRELSSGEEKDQLGLLRWGAHLSPRHCPLRDAARRKRSLMSLPSLVQFYCAFTSTVKFHCRLHLRVLQDCSDSHSLLSAYCQRVVLTQWTAFSAAALHLQTEFSRLTDLLNEMYEARYRSAGPQFSLMRVMVLMWRRGVFDPLQATLLQAVMEVLAEVRAAANQQYASLLLSQYCLCRAVVSFLDYSLQEVNVHYRTHSCVQLRTPYSLLHDSLIDSCREFAHSVNADLPLLSKRLDQDLSIVSRHFLPCSHRQVQLLYHAYEVDQWKVRISHDFFASHSAVTSRLRPQVLAEAVNSDFGAYVFSLTRGTDAKQQCSAYIELMLEENPATIACIERFNALAESLREGVKPSIDDEDLEYRMKRSKRPSLAAANCENRLFALTTDLSPAEVSVLLTAEATT